MTRNDSDEVKYKGNDVDSEDDYIDDDLSLDEDLDDDGKQFVFGGKIVSSKDDIFNNFTTVNTAIDKKFNNSFTTTNLDGEEKDLSEKIDNADFGGLSCNLQAIEGITNYKDLSRKYQRMSPYAVIDEQDKDNTAIRKQSNKKRKRGRLLNVVKKVYREWPPTRGGALGRQVARLILYLG
ncbi:unnamed protein product [Mucor hiemalis]